MGFWIVMFICNLLVPLLMIIFGRIMYKHAPKSINGVYGYRTSMSMKNEDTWKFAHDYCGRLWYKIGLIMLIPSVLVQLPFVKSSTDTIGIMTVVLETVQICVMIASIFPTEKALRKTFDKYGNRK